MQAVLDKIIPLFKDGTDLIMVLLQLIENVVKYAVLVGKGAYPDNEETTEKVFRMLFSSINMYLRTPAFILSGQ